MRDIRNELGERGLAVSRHESLTIALVRWSAVFAKNGCRVGGGPDFGHRIISAILHAAQMHMRA